MAGLYIHIPFCASRCPYCDFVSYDGKSRNTMVEYIDALLKEAEMYAQTGEIESLKFETLFIGGGTPTTIPVYKLVELIERLKNLFILDVGQLEITLEANPESVSHHNLASLFLSGVNRLSLGIQDLSNRGLSILGRRHSVEKAIEAVKEGHKIPFDSINIDLIYGFPGQTVANLKNTLETAVSIMPDHISCYELTIANGTLMEKKVLAGILTMPHENTISTMTDLVEDFLEEKGFRQYEISNFAKPGFECRHNIDCWNGRQYLGLGCSAVSYIRGRRYGNTPLLHEYIDKVSRGKMPVEWSEEHDQEKAFREAVITGLRKVEGVSEEAMQEKWGIKIQDYYSDVLDTLIEWGMIEYAENYVRFTRRGRRLANSVLCRLV